MRRLFIVLFWSALIFALIMASLPQPPSLPGDPDDKMLHILAFTALAALIIPAYPRANVFVLFLLLCLFGGMIELVQSIPALGRDAEARDWLADTLAAGLTLATAASIRRWGWRS